ncbi:MAG: hemerythrin domain-containing protein [bacterium]
MAGTTPDRVTRIEQEHRSLRKDMDDLERFARDETRTEDFSDWRLQLVWQLRDFENRLLKHFDLEEEGGFMQDVITVSPHSRRKVEMLKAEHEQIAVRLEGLIAQLKRMQEKEGEKLQRLRLELKEIMEMIREHENEEHHLIQGAYYREYGGQA